VAWGKASPQPAELRLLLPAVLWCRRFCTGWEVSNACLAAASSVVESAQGNNLNTAVVEQWHNAYVADQHQCFW
jgi:hypothetical protein